MADGFLSTMNAKGLSREDYFTREVAAFIVAVPLSGARHQDELHMSQVEGFTPFELDNLVAYAETQGELMRWELVQDQTLELNRWWSLMYPEYRAPEAPPVDEWVNYGGYEDDSTE